MSTLLEQINSPDDLKSLSTTELEKVAEEIRTKIVNTVSVNGGHLGPNLGVVELTLAIHSVLDAPRDKLIWDVGHQAYPHKIITGRRDEFHTLRQYGGISGFPRIEESAYDAFGTAHAGTSVSAALGYAIARDRLKQDYAVVAVLGDGAFTAGMAFEALNHAGDVGTPLVVILNDNEMSIAPNVGAMSEYLTRLRTDRTIHRARNDLEAFMNRIPAIGQPMVKAAERLTDTMRQLLVPGAFFEELGFSYYGPIDGHNIPLLQRVLREGIQRKSPVVIHVATEKGRGYQPAETDPGKLHALSPPKKDNKVKHVPSYSHVFADTLIELAKEDERIVAITAAMPDGTGLNRFQKQFPQRTIDVGIAEQHAATLAGGMACAGAKPVLALYSTFLQRAYDQVIHDIALQNLDVTIGIDRAGLVGDDGPTHHGCYDIAYLRTVPNTVIMAPKDENELRHMVHTAVKHPAPTFVRYPRGSGRGEVLDDEPQALPIGKSEMLRTGDDIGLIALGPWVYSALEAADQLQLQGIEATVMNARFVKPLDTEAIVEVARRTGQLVTIEEGALPGGFGSAVTEALEKAGLHDVVVRRIGIPDEFIEHGALPLLYADCGLTVENIVATAQQLVQKMTSTQQSS